jgi:hypothetical protein
MRLAGSRCSVSQNKNHQDKLVALNYVEFGAVAHQGATDMQGKNELMAPKTIRSGLSSQKYQPLMKQSLLILEGFTQMVKFPRRNVPF